MVTKEGLKILLLLTLLLPLGILNKAILFAILFLIVFTLIFFRDPERTIEDGIVSPADGKIDYLSSKRLEIFMSLLDCHVQRSPVSGIVKKIEHVPGKKYPAFLRRENERKILKIETDDGTFAVELISGIFARRIFCWVREGERVEKGQKIGMIAFGSRVALEIPEGFRFTKNLGEKVKAGERVAVRDEGR